MLAQLSGESGLAQAFKFALTQIIALTIILAWIAQADAGLGLGSLNRTSLYLLIPEQHIGTAAHHKL